MWRHKWICLIACLLIVPPAKLAAQQSHAPVIGFLSGGSPYEWTPFVAAFREGLEHLGYVDGHNASIEFRWALGNGEQAPQLARQLASQRVDILVSTGGISSFNASINASPTIPVVAIFGDDPASEKLIADLPRLDSNATGVSLKSPDIEVRRLKILQSIVPRASRIGLILNGRIIPAPELRQQFEAAADQLGLQSIVALAGTEDEIDRAFLTLSLQHVDAVVVASSAYFLDNRDRLAVLASRYKLPVMYPARAYVEASGLLSYGVDRLEAYRQLGHYTARILRGEAPQDLPILQPTQFELAINAKAAEALGLKIPQSLLTLANVVIR